MKDLSDTQGTPAPKVYELCSGGSCCPVMLQHEDRTVEITEDGVGVRLDPAQAANLARWLHELGYGT